MNPPRTSYRVHDRDAEMLAVYGAKHYDAVAIGNLAGDPELDPVAMLISGSSGVYIVDALTGQTRAHALRMGMIRQSISP